MHRALRTFSPWDTYNYDWITLKSQDPFSGFYVTRLFSFIYFCSCYRLQMSDMSPFLTTSIMEIMLQAWNILSSSLPALTHPALLPSLPCMQGRGRAEMENCSMLLSMGKNKLLHVFWKKHRVFSFVGSIKAVVLQAYNWQSWIKFFTPILIYCIGKNRHAYQNA